MKQRWKLILLIIAVLAVGGLIYSRVRAGKNKQPQAQTAQVGRGTLVVSISASGQVSSVNNLPVNTQTSGIVTTVFVHNGQAVKAGQRIAQVRQDTEGKSRQASSYASYLAAVSSENSAENSRLSADAQMWKDQQGVLNAQDTVNNRNSNNTNPSTKTTYTDLEWQAVDSAMVSANKQFLSSETSYINSDKSVNAAKASISSSWLSYQETLPTIVAPIDGVIDGLSLEPGEIITQGTSTTATNIQKIATIKTTALPLVTVNLTEIDVPRVVIGDRAAITFDAFPDKTFTGKVVSIDSSSLVSSGVTTYPTVIQLDTEVPGLYTNMSSSANIITQTKDNVLLVPSSSIQTQGGQSFLRVMQKGQSQQVAITTGLASDTQTEVTSGVSEGDTIVTSFALQTSGTQSSSGTSPFSRSLGGGGGGGGRALIGGRGG